MVFGKKANRPSKEPEPSAFKPARPDQRKAEVPGQVQHSFINAGTTVTGNLDSAGDISVEGSVEGNITCRTLTLRGEPTIMGDVHAEAVYVCGRFTGDLRTKKVVLTKTARMTGDIYYETLELQEGAEFEGGFRYTGGSALNPVRRDAASPQGSGELVHAE